ncbi:hypothetical protein JZ751_026002 [Albula glossodonta]|uniref:Uncharacterized protein n=1 Tax=Albula glossodonta TaxID=121402 RepID=A0A8T2MSR8_9TELE|nr:hypothetical protein JZ751_026002 [Albula glossodonta]
MNTRPERQAGSEVPIFQLHEERGLSPLISNPWPRHRPPGERTNREPRGREREREELMEKERGMERGKKETQRLCGAGGSSLRHGDGIDL